MEQRKFRRRLFLAVIPVLISALFACSGGEKENPPKSEQAAVASATQVPATAGAPPSLLLVTIDTWRWDYIGVSGSGKVATPALDRLAAQGVYYQKTLTACPLTTPAHATILTGLVPHRHGVRDNFHYRLKQGVETVASACLKKGYKTLAVVSGAPLRRMYGLDKGFQQYDDSGLGKEGDFSFTPSRRPAGEATSRAISMLGKVKGQAPILLWVHYYDLHAPCKAPAPFSSRYPNDAYAAAAAYVDTEIGRLLAGLPKTGGRDWIVAVTGDHGEGLGDHGEKSHGILLYESTVEVPLIIWTGHPLKLAAYVHPGLVDVAPTLCSLAGVSFSASLDGADLSKSIPEDRWLSSESAYAEMAYGVNPIFLLRQGNTVWIHSAVDEVYDVNKDPAQTTDLAHSSGAAFSAQAVGHTAWFFGKTPAADFLGTTLSLSSGEADAIRGLGYVGGRVPAEAEVQPADLRLFVRDMNKFDTALAYFEEGAYERAEAAIREFLAKYPRSSRGYMELGLALVARKKYQEAASAFTKAIGIDPLDSVSALNLGNIHMMEGDRAGALKLYEQSLKAEEQQPEAHLNAALILKDTPGKASEACVHLRRFLELAPADREAPAIRKLMMELEKNRIGG
jgi:Tfp pilus assembly protein PilF